MVAFCRQWRERKEFRLNLWVLSSAPTNQFQGWGHTPTKVQEKQVLEIWDIWACFGCVEFAAHIRLFRAAVQSSKEWSWSEMVCYSYFQSSWSQENNLRAKKWRGSYSRLQKNWRIRMFFPPYIFISIADPGFLTH